MDTNQEEVERVNTDVLLSTSIQADRQQNVSTTNKSSVSNQFFNMKIETVRKEMIIRIVEIWTQTKKK